MAGSKTDALEQRILDHLFKGGATPALTALSTVYIALYIVVPSDSSGGTEVTGSGYIRQAVAAGSLTRTGNSISNNAEIVYPAVTGAPYAVVGWAVLDALNGGNMLYWGDCASTTMNVGDIPRFAAGSLVITED